MDEVFDLKSRLDPKGIIRRTFSQERGMRAKEFNFDPANPDAWFKVVFDAFCWKWDLYGIENMLPLLMKVTVNLTPYGMMIFLPKWMSFDLKRDLLIKALTELQRSRGVRRQGAKICQTRRELAILGVNVLLADREAEAKELIGEERRLYIIRKTGLPPWTDMRRILKLRAVGEKVMSGKTGEPATKPSRVKKVEDPDMKVKLARVQATVVEQLDPAAQKELFKWLGPRVMP